MVRSVWVEAVSALDIDGDMVFVTLVADGEPLILRGKRCIALEGLNFCQRRYGEEEASQRIAEVLPFNGGGRKRH